MEVLKSFSAAISMLKKIRAEKDFLLSGRLAQLKNKIKGNKWWPFLQSFIQKKGLSEPVIEPVIALREELAAQYLHGEGIEIGALHSPLKVSSSAKVKYVDKLPLERLRTHYPELASKVLVAVDIVDDGETLSQLADSSQDFVIANYFLEHCQNPILALENMIRVLRRHGVLFLAIPDKNYTFDKDRPVTPYEHLLTDYHEGPESSKKRHYEEYVHYAENIEDVSAAIPRIEELMRLDYSIHFHVWTQLEVLEFFLKLKKRLPFDIELLLKNLSENIVILRKH